MVVYVDVLFVVNFFITYLLLLFTSLMLKRKNQTIRLLISSAVGGLYSLVILVDNLNVFLTAAGKLLVSFVLVFIAFGFRRLSVYIKAVLLFYFSNLLFLGIIMGIRLIFAPAGVALNNGTVYFDISAGTLLISASVAYIVSVLIIRIYNHTIEKKEIYSLTVYKDGSSSHLFALADSGNKLKEPFSDYPVIVVDKNKISFSAERVVPFNTVGGEGVLQAFKPDKVVISNGKKSFETDRVFVAASNVESNDFSAILNPEILNI